MQQPYSFPDIHTDPKDTAKRTTLQPKITLQDKLSMVDLANSMAYTECIHKYKLRWYPLRG